MQIKKIHIQNYRCILDETLECNNLTVLIGRNGSGKSLFLRALKLFMDTADAPSAEDYYNRESGQREIKIEVTYSHLTEAGRRKNRKDKGTVIFNW